MTIRREFFDWRGAGLAQAAQWLIAKYAAGSTLDLEKVVIAVPGTRVGRRLLEILIDEAQQKSLTLVPARIVTVGTLAELLYEAKKPFAHALTQQLAWVRALLAIDPADLSRLIPAAPPRDDFLAWLPLGAMLMQLHTELAADTLDFADVADRGRRLDGFDEADRWRVLEAVQKRYLAILDSLGLWDRQTARLFAIEHAEGRTEADIVLLGTVDLDQAQRAMLDQVADRVTALVFAPPGGEDRFDEHGCLVPENWLTVNIDLADDRIERVDGPGDQADAVLRAIAALDGRYEAQEITVGVPNERLVPYVQQRLAECEVPARYGVGITVRRTAPFQLMIAVADYLETRSASSLAALLRHPAMAGYLRSKNLSGDWLSALDEYYQQHLPLQVALAQLGIGDGAFASVLQDACTAVEQLVSILGDAPRRLSDWRQPVVELLLAIFGREALRRDIEPDRTILLACEKIADAFDGLAQIDARLAPPLGPVEALRLVLPQAERETIPPPAEPGTIELLGWLELPLDDSPALIVTGFNEGIVPASRNGDMFLPNELRRQLKVEDNERRYARDAYALGMLAASRQDLKVIVGRRWTDGEPLLPSRLLLACGDEQLAARTRWLFTPTASGPRRVALPGSLRAKRKHSDFPVPRPVQLAAAVSSMRVTEFRDYLACPYRYYLKHRLGLKCLADTAEELDNAQFGSLLHDVLKAFGNGPAADSADEGEIDSALNLDLNQIVVERFGDLRLPAVSLQVEQIRLRLRQFAAWQARWRSEGWRIHCVEQAFRDGAAQLVVDGEPMFLRGRIDRIDTRGGSECVIFDYKTGDTAKTPEQTHRKQSDWVDLQLPLYRHLVKGLDLPGSPRLGYIVLPKDTAQTGGRVAEWTEPELSEADRAAERIIRLVRQQEFWPPKSLPPVFSEDFAAICQDGQFGAALAQAAELEASAR